MEALVSVGDDGVLNQTLPSDLSQIWIDRDLMRTSATSG
jgi:hypothetical protein